MVDEPNELVVAVDCSTTACKAFAWDARGHAQAEGRCPIALDHPGPDAWQQDAEQWWLAFCGSVRQLTRALGARVAQVRALAITHQRETFVLCDAAGVPLHPALTWMDARCAAAVAQAKATLGAERLHRLSGKPACTTPSLYKLIYLLAAHPELVPLRPRLLDVHGFLVWRATGRFATSLGSADPLGLVDMEGRDWSEPLCALAGLGRDALPELVPPGVELGRLRVAVAADLGLPPELPVVAGTGDGQAAALGAGLLGPGRAYLNLGTAVVSGVISPDYRCDRAYRTLYGAAPGTFLLESDLQGGTFTVSWLVDRWLRRAARADAPSFEALVAELEAEARTLEPGADGLVLVPYWNGVMDPYWDDGASGIVVGWTGSHGPAHLYRAILEGIACEQRLRLAGLESAGARVQELVVVGGGSKSDLWCQILADVLDRPMLRASTAEATALGVGLLAAVAGGLHADLPAAVAAMTSTSARFAPGPDRDRYDRLYREIYRDLYPALRQPLQRLAAFRQAAGPTGRG